MDKVSRLIGFGMTLAMSLTLPSCGEAPQKETAPKEMSEVRIPAEDFPKIQALIEEGKSKEALALLQHYEGDLSKSLEEGPNWISLFIQAYTKEVDIPSLLTMYVHFPQSFNDHEEASIYLASAFIATRNPSDFERIREQWSSRETLTPKWMGVDADFLVIQGNTAEAIQLLKSQQFEGEEDVGRLVRLAILEGQNSAKQAWEYLAKAQEKDQDNPDIRLLRARLLENLGKKELALMEYTAAARLDPSRTELRDQVAEFHIRQREYMQALQLWAYGLKEPTSDTIWLKALFWERMTQGLNPALFEEKAVPEGTKAPLITYLLNLPEGTYWDAQAFSEIENGNQLLQTEQSTFWLRLMQLLQEGREQDALSLIEFNHFSPVSWCPELELNLRRVLLYRQTGQFFLKGEDVLNPSSELIANQVGENVPRHQFYRELDQLIERVKKDPTSSTPPEMQDFLTGEEALAAVVMASGWLEAGLALHQMEVIPSTYPQWVAFAIGQSLRFNRGADEALKFISLQHPTPSLRMLEGELLVSTGSLEAGVLKLEQASQSTGPIGERSTWRLVLSLLKGKQYSRAREVLTSKENFGQTLTGRELHARSFLLEGNRNEATRIYGSLVSESSEAQSYLARLAYEQQDWSRAKELTEQLLRKFPNSQPLRANLARILQQMEGDGSYGSQTLQR